MHHCIHHPGFFVIELPPIPALCTRSWSVLSVLWVQGLTFAEDFMLGSTAQYSEAPTGCAVSVVYSKLSYHIGLSSPNSATAFPKSASRCPATVTHIPDHCLLPFSGRCGISFSPLNFPMPLSTTKMTGTCQSLGRSMDQMRHAFPPDRYSSQMPITTPSLH